MPKIQNGKSVIRSLFHGRSEVGTKVLTMVWAPPPNPDPSLRRTSGEGWSVIAMRSHDQWRGRLGTETGCDARDRM
jgi:hypothetical protein